MPWANGGGTTAEVATGPAHSEPWHWRLSIADVETDGPFSSLPGIDRLILVVHGDGMALTVDDTTHIVRPGEPPLPFTGEAITTCRLLGGPINDLNLMVRRDRARGALRRVHLAAGDVCTPGADDVAVVLVDGAASADGTSLQRFDALVSLGPGDAPTIVATAPTDLAVASVYSRDAHGLL
jgi:environmental stress-induced protein Ves